MREQYEPTDIVFMTKRFIIAVGYYTVFYYNGYVAQFTDLPLPAKPIQSMSTEGIQPSTA